MDLASLIPIVAVGVGIPGFVAFVALLAGHVRKMKELEIREKELQSTGGDPMLGATVDVMRDELAATRAEVAELQERLNFTERLLASGSPPQES